MKKKLIKISIISFLIVLLLSTLFFDSTIEKVLKFKPDLSCITNNSFEVHFIDVGQGDAVAIKFPNGKTMLVDSGPESGKENLAEYLSQVFFSDGYNTFDYVFLSHSDTDHSGNMEYILDTYIVKNFYRPYIFSTTLESINNGIKTDNVVYDEVLTTLRKSDITTYFANNGAKIDTGSGIVEIYTTENNSFDETNEYSTILVISSNGSKVYLGGDSGEDVESELVNRKVLLDVDLMKLSHHGSKYSNSEQLLNELKPEFVVCSVGENSYGHPASDVLLRLAKYDELNGKNTYEKLKTTIDDGNVIYYTNKESAMSVVTIKSLGDYLFLDWEIVVIVSCSILLIVNVIIITNKNKSKN